MKTIRYYEELAMNAWPSLTSTVYDGWIYRWADGYSKRANSVQPLYPPQLPLEEKLAESERFYAGRGLPAVFKMTEAAEPAGLDAVLEDRGYELQDPVRILTLTLGELPQPAHTEASLSGELTGGWLDSFCQFNPGHRPHRSTIRQLYRYPAADYVFASLRHEGTDAACGLGVLLHGELGLFDIVTDPRRRRQGLGEALLLHLLHWARDRGAHGAYLQVLSDNAPAIRLYEKLGFREAYRQWFRVKPL